MSVSQDTEQRLARRVEELEHKRDELTTKLKAYERNILQLIDTQAELAAKQASTAPARGSGDKGAAAAAAAAEAEAVGALQRQLLEKEEEIKRLMSATPAKAAAEPVMGELVGECERLCVDSFFLSFFLTWPQSNIHRPGAGGEAAGGRGGGGAAAQGAGRVRP